MEYNVPVSAMALNDEIEGFYILKSANPKVTANGKPFLTGALSDRTGVMEMKVWDYAGPLTAADEGKVVKVRGTVGEFRGMPPLTAGRSRGAAAAAAGAAGWGPGPRSLERPGGGGRQGSAGSVCALRAHRPGGGDGRVAKVGRVHRG